MPDGNAAAVCICSAVFGLGSLALGFAMLTASKLTDNVAVTVLKAAPLSPAPLATSSLAGYIPTHGRKKVWRRGQLRGGGGRRGRGAHVAPASTLSLAHSEATVHTHIVPQGGALAIECAHGTRIRRIRFASFGIPTVYANGSVGEGQCHSRRSRRIVAQACVGQSHCCLPVDTSNFHDDPCRGKVKTLAVVLEGCAEHTAHTRFKRHCSLVGQPLLCDEDIEFLAGLSLPPASPPIRPHVAIMVDTSWRPRLQHYVVHNVRNHTGWHIQCVNRHSNTIRLPPNCTACGCAAHLYRHLALAGSSTAHPMVPSSRRSLPTCRPSVALL